MRRAKDLLKTDMNKESFTKMEAFSSITIAAEEASQFIDTMIDQSTLKNMARVIKHTRETHNIRDIGFGTGEFLKPSGTFSSADVKKTFAHELIALTTDELRGAVVVYDKDLEDGIEGAAFTKTLIGLVTKQMANELEQFYWLAEKETALSGFANNDIKSLRDGWRYQIDHSQSGATYYNDVTGAARLLCANNTKTGHYFDFLDSTADYIAEQGAAAPYNIEFKLNKMITAIPNKYAGEIDKFRFFMNPRIWRNHQEYVSRRATQLGDLGINGKIDMSVEGIPVVTAPLMPLTMEVYSTAYENYDATNGALADVLLTTPDNLIVNFQKEIFLEPERSAADRATYFYYTIRTGMAIGNVNKCVLLARVVPI